MFVNSLKEDEAVTVVAFICYRKSIGNIGTVCSCGDTALHNYIVDLVKTLYIEIYYCKECKHSFKYIIPIKSILVRLRHFGRYAMLLAMAMIKDSNLTTS